MKKKFFEQAFDEATLAKLDLYKSFCQEWLPVFISRKETIYHNVNVFDFFAGAGTDSEGVKGSPLIAIDIIKAYQSQILEKNINVSLFLNELDKDTHDKLLQNTAIFTNENYFSLKVSNMNFNDCFDLYYPIMQKMNTANLIFIDQFGIKEVPNEIFQKLIELKHTDFIFFISSSYLHRFGETDEFKKTIMLPDNNNRKYNSIHREVTNFYASLIPANKTYYLAPFSIKRKSNIHGLIFGSNHSYGAEKFLKQCWKSDKLRGEANFDIDSESIVENQLDVFSGKPKMAKKIEAFEENLKEKIINREIASDKRAYTYGLSEGFTPKQVRKVLEDMIKNKQIGSNISLINEKVHKIDNVKFIELLK